MDPNSPRRPFSWVVFEIRFSVVIKTHLISGYIHLPQLLLEFQKIASFLDCKSRSSSRFVARNCQELSSGLRAEHSQGIHQSSEMWECQNRRWRPRGPAEPAGQHGLSSFLHPLQFSQSSWKLKKTKKRKASSWERPGERQSLRWPLGVGPMCFPWLWVLNKRVLIWRFLWLHWKGILRRHLRARLRIIWALTLSSSWALGIRFKHLSPTTYNTYNFHTIVQLHKEMQTKLCPSLMQRVSLRTLLSIKHTAAYVEVRPVWRSLAWIFLSPALVTRPHMFFISPHMFLITVLFVRLRWS